LPACSEPAGEKPSSGVERSRQFSLGANDFREVAVNRAAGKRNLSKRVARGWRNEVEQVGKEMNSSSKGKKKAR